MLSLTTPSFWLSQRQACICRVRLRPACRSLPAWTSLRQFRPAWLWWTLGVWGCSLQRRPGRQASPACKRLQVSLSLPCKLHRPLAASSLSAPCNSQVSCTCCRPCSHTHHARASAGLRTPAASPAGRLRPTVRIPGCSLLPGGDLQLQGNPAQLPAPKAGAESAALACVQHQPQEGSSSEASPKMLTSTSRQYDGPMHLAFGTRFPAPPSPGQASPAGKRRWAPAAWPWLARAGVPVMHGCGQQAQACSRGDQQLQEHSRRPCSLHEAQPTGLRSTVVASKECLSCVAVVCKRRRAPAVPAPCRGHAAGAPAECSSAPDVPAHCMRHVAAQPAGQTSLACFSLGAESLGSCGS